MTDWFELSILVQILRLRVELLSWAGRRRELRAPSWRRRALPLLGRGPPVLAGQSWDLQHRDQQLDPLQGLLLPSGHAALRPR